MNSRRAPAPAHVIGRVRPTSGRALLSRFALLLAACAPAARSQVLVDGADQGAALTVSDGVDHSVNGFTIAPNADTTGAATLTGAGTSYSVSVGFSTVIGQNGSGTLELQDHAQLNANDWMAVGSNAGSTGVLNANGGASFHAFKGLAIGNNPGATGTVTLSGTGTSATADQFTLVGWKGAGTLNVQAGAGFTSSASFGVGADANGAGAVTVSGGSTFKAEDGMSIGNGVGATGSFLHTGGNTWAQVASYLNVGWDGTATLNIEDGANLNVIAKDGAGNGSVAIGPKTGSGDGAGGFVTVRGRNATTTYGSALNVGGSIDVGTQGGFGRMDVLNSGFVQAGNLNVTSGLVDVYGGTLKIVTDNPNWGIYVAHGGIFDVGNGSGFTTPHFNLDGGAAHFGSWISTTSFGEGPLQSTWDVHDGAVMTHAGLGFGQNAGDNTSVNLWNKGSVTGTGDVNIGQQGTASVNVGGGSTLSGHHLNVGNDLGSDGTLHVNGASNDSTPVPSSAAFGHVHAGGKGTAHINISSGATLSAGDGLTIGNDAGGTGAVWIGNPGTVATFARYVNVGWNGTGSLNIEDGAQASLVLAEPRDGDNGGGYLNIAWSDDNPESAVPNGVLTITGSHDGTPSRLTVEHGTALGQQGGWGVLNLDQGGELVTENVYVKKGAVHVNNGAHLKIVSSGGIDIDAPSTFSLGGGNVNARYLNSHGRITGGGTLTLTETLFSDGEINPGETDWTGFLQVFGNLTQSGPTKIDFKGTNRDVIHVEGNVTLNGPINVAFAEDFTPVNGQSYGIIDWTGNKSTGPNFALNGLTSLSGWTFLPSWSGNALALIAVSDTPSAAALDDDFADNTHWDDWSYPAGKHNLSFSGNQLHVVTTDPSISTWGAAPVRDSALSPPNHLVGSFDSPWSVSVKVHLGAGLATQPGDVLRAFIYVQQQLSGSDAGSDLSVGLFRSNSRYPAGQEDGAGSQLVVARNYSQGPTIAPGTAGVTDAIFKVEYTAEKKLVASYASPAAPTDFTVIATYDPAVIWSMGSASFFRVWLVGQAFSGASNRTGAANPGFADGDATFADFHAVGLLPESVASAQTQSAAANLPQITSQPDAGGPLGVLAGGSTTLHVQATGSGLGYQWRKDGQPIDDATGNSYTIALASETSAGSYDVIVRTAAGAVRSAPVKVQLVDAAPAFPNFAWRNPLPPASSLTDVVFADGKFVAVGVDGVVRTSPNGTSWTTSATPTSHTVLNGIGYSAALDLFTAAGSGGDLFTWTGNSGDPWVRRNISNSDYYTAVAASPERIVVRGNSNFLVTSTDGTTWTRQTLATGGGVESMAFGGGVFVAVGYSRIERSTDGLTWNVISPPGAATNNAINDVEYIDGQFIAVGGNGLVMTSPTGETWTVHATGFGNYFRTVEKHGGTWVVFDNSPRYVTSTDLSVFTTASVPGSMTAFLGSASGAGRIVAVGGGGEIVSSNNGTSWSAHGASGGLDAFFDGVYAEGKFVFVGSEGTIVTSPDGVTFTRRLNPDGTNWLNAVIHDGSRFVAAAYDRILVSEDGETWSAANPNVGFATNWRGLAYNGTTYVAVGDNGKIMRSTDASTWSESSSGIGDLLWSATWFGDGTEGFFVAVGANGSVLTSPTGETWTKRTTPLPTANLQAVRAIGGKLFAVGDGWALLVSTNGTDWTRITLQGGGGYNTHDIAQLPNGLYVIAGVQGGFYTSPDGVHWTWQGLTITRGQIERIVVGPNSMVLGGRGGTLLQATFPVGNTPPSILAAPASRTVATGGNVPLSVTVSGSGPFSYQWFHDGEPIAGSAAMGRAMTLVNVGPASVGNYTVTVYGVGGTITSAAANVSLADPATSHTDFFDSNADWALNSSQSQGNGWVDVANGRLEYITTASGPTPLDRRSLIPSPGAGFASFNGHNALIGRTDRDWSVSVDVHVKNFTLNPDSQTTPRATPGQGWRADLLVIDLQNALFDRGLLINAKYDATYDTTPRGTVTTWGNQSYTDFDASGLTEFKLAASYSAATHMLSAYVSTDGGASWRLQRAFDVTATLENGGWAIPANYQGTAFGVQLGAASNNLAVAAGDLTFDNFTYSGLTLGAYPARVNVPPRVYGQVQSRTVAAGGSTTFSVMPHGIGPFTYQWQRDGVDLSGAANSSLTLNDVQPGDAGVYQVVTGNNYGARPSQPAIVGLASTGKVVGAATEVGVNILHPAGFVYDQVLLTGPSASVTADPGQVTRVSYVDLDDDIVQVEFAGAGTLTILLDQASGPAAPVNYNQAGVQYEKGHASFVVTGADATTTLSLYTVGSSTVTNTSILKEGVTYDGVADVGYLAIMSTDGKFGALHAADAEFAASHGLAGVYAPGVQFTGTFELGDVSASDNATPTLVFGAASEVRIVGGDLAQANDDAIWIDALANPDEFQYVAGVDSHGRARPALTNAGSFSVFAPNGVAPGSPLIGSWLRGNPTDSDAAVITFLPNGYYYLAHLADEPGMERGVYTWNPATNSFSANAMALGLYDSTELGGLNLIGMLDGATATLAPDHNTLTLASPQEEGPLTLTRVRSSVDPLVGSWLLGLPGGEESSMSTFLPNGYYFQIDDGVADEEGGPGMELGTYTVSSGVISAVASVDTSGTNWGLGGALLTFQIDGDAMNASEGDSSFTLSRVGHFTASGQATIDSFSPGAIYAGAQVTITGTNFNDIIAVKFNGVDATSFHVDSATQITATAPANLTVGPISIVTPDSTITGSTSFALNPGPSISQQPHDLAVTSGDSATFEVTATGAGTLTYQWRRFGFPITGATARTYTIDTALLTDTDYYDVVVTDSAGSTTSMTVRLDVAPTSYPGQLGVDPTWSVPIERDNVTIYQILPLAGGGFLVAGDFSKIGNHETGAVARFIKNPDDGAWIPDPSFSSPIRGTATRIARQSDGKIVVAGTFTVETTQGLRSGLVRLNDDGSVDETFAPANNGSGGLVAITSVNGSDKIYAVAGFPGGVQLVRLNADGTRDTSFGLAYAPGTLYRTLVALPDGKLAVSVEPTGRKEIARLLATDGSLDSTFSPVPVVYVPNLAVDAAGRIYAVGSLEPNMPSSCGRVAVNGGNWDSNFTQVAAVGGSFFTLAIEPGGTVLVGGVFNAVHVGGNDVPRVNIARLNADGTLASALPDGSATSELGAISALVNDQGAEAGIALANRWPNDTTLPLVLLGAGDAKDTGFVPDWRAPGIIRSIVRQPGGDLVIAGNFAYVGSEPQRYIARLKDTGAGVSVDTDTFAKSGRPNGLVQIMRQQADGQLLLAGVFDQFTETPAAPQEAWARLTEDGVRDPSFARAAGSSSVGQDKQGLIPLPGGAAIAGSWWHPDIGSGGLIKLLPTGSYDQSFSANLGANPGHPIAGAVQSDGKIVLGGFSWLNRDTMLVRLGADGKFEHNYHRPDLVLGMAITPGDVLWVAHGGGVSRYLPNGDLDGSFTAPAGWGLIGGGLLNIPLFPQNDGKLILPANVGLKTGAPDSLKAGPQMLRFNANGSIDPTFGLSGLTAPVSAIVQRDDGQFYFATDGVIRRTKTLAAPAITTPPTVAPSVLTGTSLTLTVDATSDYLSYQWRKGGVAIPDATTASFIIPTLKVTDSGDYDVVVSNAAGAQTSAIAKVVAVPAIVTVPPESTTILAGQNATFSVTANAQLTPLTYQWRRNGLNIPGATNATLTLNNVPLNGGGAITVVVTNSAGGFIVSTPATLAVNPVAPVITSPLTATGIIGRSFTYQTGTNTAATFSATGLPAGLTINVNTGVISGAPSALGTSNVAITAHNITGDDTKTLVLTVNPPPPVISSPVAAGSRVNQPITYTIAASNSPTSYTATDLPPGLTLADNLISGTPTQAGTFVVTITATNASGSVSQTVQFTIQPALNAPAYSGTTQPSGTQNATFSFTPTFANGVTLYEIVAGTLPAGLTLNPTTGLISGTPTAVGRFSVTLRATGPGGVTNVPLTFVVNPAPTAPLITSASTVTTTVGASSFSFQLTTDQLTTGLLTTGYNAAPLPTGLALHDTTGLIDGTPSAAGTTAVQVSARNLFGTGPTSVLVVTINPSPNAPVITSSPVVEGRVGVATTGAAPLYQIAVNHPATQFALTSGALPPGLDLDAATGAVSGTPTSAGSFRAAFAATSSTDGKGPSLEVLFTIKPPLNVPAITSNGTAAGQVGQPFSYTITATNSPSSFTATGLPAWMTQSGALLSGIPNAATTTPLQLTVSAANPDGAGAPKTVSITIAPAPATPVVTSATTAAGRVGLAFNYRVTASAAPTSFSATNLPPGLTLDPATGVISGSPTQAGSFAVKLSAGNTAGVGPATMLALNIAPAPQAPTIISDASATGKVGVAFNYDIVATPGTITSYEVVGTLPLGLSVNTIEGTITGKPAEPGLFLVEMTATSEAGTSLPQALILSINPADNVPVITSPIVALATVGADFAYTITATNMPETTPYPPAITLDAVHLPTGLAVNPSTGQIQGRPIAAGLFTATLVGTNANGTGPFRDLTIYVQPAPNAPVITSSPSTSAQVGVAFSYQITATNNPDAFEVVDPPAWMTINGQSGTLGGVPTTPGTFSVKLIASNAGGDSNPASLTLYVAPAANTPVITSTRTAGGQLGASFSYRITATNTPTSFVATGLPAGLTLDSATGDIAGTPQASGTFKVLLSAVNGNGSGLPVTLTLTINPSLQLVAP